MALQVKGLRPELHPPPSPTLSSSSSRSGRVTETQFLAAALQRPRPQLHHITPAQTASLPSQPALSAGPAPIVSTLPGIDLGRAISNFTQNENEGNQIKKRKLTEERTSNSTPPVEETDEVRENKNLVIVDAPVLLSRPSSEDSNQDEQSRDPLRDSPGRASTASRPHSVQGRGMSQLLCS